MKIRQRQSLIINNFFTLASIIMITVTIVLYSKFILPADSNKVSKKKIEKLSCQSDSFSTAKIFNQKLLNKSIKPLSSGYYKLHGSYIKSIYTKSIIEDFVSLSEIDNYYINSIGNKTKKDIKKFLLINYDIIEYDKKDLKNKDKNKKFRSGSINTSFRVNGNEIFRFNTNFKFYDKNEIKSRIDCAIKVYRNHAK